MPISTRSTALAFMIALSLGLIWLPVQAGAKNAEDAAVLRLQPYLDKTLPARGLSMKCVDLIPEESTARYVEIAVRERHGDGCPGDPDVAPIVDRYRVPKAFTRLQRYDVVEDRWIPIKP